MKDLILIAGFWIGGLVYYYISGIESFIPVSLGLTLGFLFHKLFVRNES